MTSWTKALVSRIAAACSRWIEDDGPLMAAAIAYYVALSFFPLLLTLIAGIGLFFKFTDSGQDAQQAVLLLVQNHLSRSAAESVRQALDQVRDASTFHGPIAFFVMLFSSIASFVQLQQAFDRIARLKTQHKGLLSAVRMVLFERLIAFLMLCGLGLVMLALFVTTLVLTGMESYTVGVLPWLGHFRRPLQIGIDLVLNACLFTVLYRVIPKSPASLKISFRGGLLAAVIWEAGRQILASLLIGTKYTDAYGVLGSFIGLMLWCYYAVALFLLGAEYIEVIRLAAPHEPVSLKKRTDV